MTILDRFRRMLVPPGRPGEALGVPDSGAGLSAELDPVLARLDDVDAEVMRITQEGEAEARARLADGERESAAILAEGRRRAAAARAEAADAARAQARARVESLEAEARREAERIRAQREAVVAELVTEVVECVRQTGR